MVVSEKEQDEYLLNPCQTASGKYFVVELCETIQPSALQLANFELFSSSPRQFTLWGSERFPKAEWTPLGQFEAQDLRQIQRFPIPEQMRTYVKFVKVRLAAGYWAGKLSLINCVF